MNETEAYGVAYTPRNENLVLASLMGVPHNRQNLSAHPKTIAL
jgi:hypothetical protein